MIITPLSAIHAFINIISYSQLDQNLYQLFYYYNYH
jgi:hypothetical protein